MNRTHPLMALTMAFVIATSCLVYAQEEPATAAGGDAASSGTTATAADLIREAQRAVGQVVKAARDEGKLPQDGSDAKPFWNAMKELNEALDKADTGLTLKDETFFSNLAVSRAAVEQAAIALEMNDVSNPVVLESMTTLRKIVEAIHDNYSKEAARLKQGGELTAGERKQLSELKAQQDELLRKLKEVEKKAGKDNEKIQEAAKKIAKEAKRIRRSRNDVGGFVGAMAAASIINNMVWGWHWWWGPWGYWGPGYIDINIIIWDDWIDVCPYDWEIVDYEVDIDDLGLDVLDLDTAELTEMDGFLDEGDFSVDDADMVEITSDLYAGWDEVDTEMGADVMQGMEDNFDHMPYEPEFAPNTFDDVGGFDDFGGGFDDFGGDW